MDNMDNMGKKPAAVVAVIAGKPESKDEMTPPPGAANPIEQLLDSAESSGKLKPVEDALKSEGADITARDFLQYAQYDERTKAKTPEVLAKMIAEDPSLIGDIIAEMEKRTDSELSEYQNPDEMMRSRMKEAKASEMPEDY